MTLNRGEKVSLECIDDINTFWIRQDYQPLPNLMNIYYGSKLQLKSINCNMNGIIYCGRQDINWNAMNVDIDWKVIQMNIDNCEMIKDINMELIVIDEYPKDINISCQQNGTWTFINSKNTIKLEGNLNITIRDELDLGIATCKYDNMIIKKVEITSTDNNIFRLKGYDCKNNLQKVDLIDNQQVKVCDESKFSSYDKALESKFTILHKKTFKTILVNTCKVKLTTLEGYCSPNSIAWKLGIIVQDWIVD